MIDSVLSVCSCSTIAEVSKVKFLHCIGLNIVILCFELSVPLALQMNKTMFPARNDPRRNLQKTPKLVDFLIQLASCSRSAALIRVLA